MVNIPDEVTFYVRGALSRAIQTVENDIRSLTKALGEVKDRPASTFSSQMEGLLDYQQQWLREAKEAFDLLPKELQPHSPSLR